MKQPVHPESAPKPLGPYSPGLLVGNLVFVAGQGPLDPKTGATVGDTIAEQTRQVLTNIRSILEAAGASMDEVVKSTVHLANLEDFAAFNAVYREFFSEPYPVRTTVGSALLDDILVEIDVIAVKKA